MFMNIKDFCYNLVVVLEWGHGIIIESEWKYL